MKRHALRVAMMTLGAVFVSCAVGKAPPKPPKLDPNAEEAAGEGEEMDSNSAEQIEQEFDVNVIEKNSVSFNGMNSVFTQEISLDAMKESSALDFVQVDREMIARTYKQGAAGIPYDDTYTQGQYTGLLDVLFVVDNSSGMTDEQDLLKGEWSSVISSISGADYRVAVTTTDSSESCVRAIIQKGDSLASSKFSAAIDAGNDGSATERGIYRAKQALSCSTANWVRPGSFLAIVFFSTEDNCSDDECYGESVSQPSYLTSYLANTMGRTSGTDYKFYGLYWKPTSSSCSNGVDKANIYDSLVASSGGFAGSICSTSFGPTIDSMSSDWSKKLKSQIALKDIPDAGSLVIKVNGSVSSGYTLNGNVVTFNPKPVIGASIQATYKTGAGAQLQAFDLGADPALETVKVMVNGAEAASTTYTIDSAAQKITFTSAPPPSADIQATFRRNVALKKEFDIGLKVAQATLKVSVNAVDTADYTFDAATGKITFNAAPPDASTVKAQFVRHISPILDYTINGAVSIEEVVDMGSGANVTYAFEGMKLSVDAAEYSFERKISVKYKDATSNTAEIVLPHTPIEDSLKVSTDEMCSLGSGITLDGNKLLIDCDINGDGLFEIEYDYHPAKEVNLSFTVNEVSQPDEGKWTVSVNGSATEDFTRKDNVITLARQPDVDSKILISFEPTE
ncbi:MAG: hypothetical protein AB7T49_10320 [Oligoflexales bacterium]